MTTKEQKIINFCKEALGSFYIWGGTGYILTQSRLNQLINQYPEYVSQSTHSKAIGHIVYDCAGLVRKAMKQVGISMVSGATSQWKKTTWAEKGTIDNLPKNKVCCLYRQKGNIMQHTGIYLGNGYVIDARGTKSGTIETKFESYPWTHWGIPKGLYTNQELNENPTQEVLKVLYKAKVTAESGSSVNMRASASKMGAKLKQIPLNTVVDVVETGNEWCKIVYDGITGFMMAEFLEKIEEVEGEYYVRIKCETAAEAKRLVELLGTATAG